MRCVALRNCAGATSVKNQAIVISLSRAYGAEGAMDRGELPRHPTHSVVDLSPHAAEQMKASPRHDAGRSAVIR